MNEESIKIRKAQDERLFRLRLVSIFVPTVLGVLAWVNVSLISDLLGINYRFVAGTAAYLIGIGASYFLMVYLKGGIRLPAVDKFTESMKPNFPANSFETSQIYEELEELRRKISEISYAQLQLKEGQLEAIIGELKETIGSDVADELESRYARPALTNAQIKQAKDNYRNSTDRLSKEIETLTRRANLNLVIGVITTFIAVGLLTYMVLGNDVKLDTLTGLISYYVPRVTVVIFIEVFSFFFLKLYKSNLAEIKYYQKEITIILTQQVAYESAVLSNDKGALLSFVESGVGKQTDTDSRPTGDASKQIEHLSKMVQETSRIISALSKDNK